jgi:hypothetical protein
MEIDLSQYATDGILKLEPYEDSGNTSVVMDALTGDSHLSDVHLFTTELPELGRFVQFKYNGRLITMSILTADRMYRINEDGLKRNYYFRGDRPGTLVGPGAFKAKWAPEHGVASHGDPRTTRGDESRDAMFSPYAGSLDEPPDPKVGALKTGAKPEAAFNEQEGALFRLMYGLGRDGNTIFRVPWQDLDRKHEFTGRLPEYVSKYSPEQVLDVPSALLCLSRVANDFDEGPGVVNAYSYGLQSPIHQSLMGFLPGELQRPFLFIVLLLSLSFRLNNPDKFAQRIVRWIEGRVDHKDIKDRMASAIVRPIYIRSQTFNNNHSLRIRREIFHDD